MTSDVRPFAVTIHTGTDAFKPEPTGELVRILREIAEQIEVGRDYRKSVPVLDIKGNAVGSFMLELAEREQDLDGLQAKFPSPLGS
jgi:hypothetical protein